MITFCNYVFYEIKVMIISLGVSCTCVIFLEAVSGRPSPLDDAYEQFTEPVE